MANGKRQPRKAKVKGKQGDTKTTARVAGAKPARRRKARTSPARTQGRQRREQCKRVRCPVCRQWATAWEWVLPPLVRDAMGRKARKEKRRLVDLARRRRILNFAGDHPRLVALQHVVRETCARYGIAGNMLATLSGIREPTVRKFLKCEGKCSGKTVYCVMDAMGWTDQSAAARVRRWLDRQARRGR